MSDSCTLKKKLRAGVVAQGIGGKGIGVERGRDGGWEAEEAFKIREWAVFDHGLLHHISFHRFFPF